MSETRAGGSPSSLGGAPITLISAAADPAEALAERLAVDLALAWRAGRRRPVEEVLEAHPEVRDHPRAAVRLIYEEFCLRQELGEGTSSTEVVGRFPRFRDELCVLLEGHRLLVSAADEPAFPRVGEVFEGATLLAELGRGGAGRVYLATQAELADRPVVLKVTARLGAEHRSLARLRHGQIVPLYAAWELPAAGLRVLCMPYLGRTTLARLLRALRDRPSATRTGAAIAAVLARDEAESPVPLPARGPGVDWLARASYEQAVCWMGALLAGALHHGHERGLVHLDVKPSNVLIAADGTPMLLDYHLARGPIRPGEPTPGLIGGTPAYMAPEQLDALEAARDGRPIAAGVDARADVFALGLVLFEALGGAPPEGPGVPARSLRRLNSAVSPALAELVARCLARDPRRRYPDARALAEDLGRHLADRPLRGVANRSVGERWRKWRRRHPHAPSLLVMGLAVAAAVALAVASSAGRWVQRLREAEAALARVPDDGRATPEAAAALERALAGLRGMPGGGGLARTLSARLRVARRNEAAERLNRDVDRLRFEAAADSPDRSDLRALDALCRALWSARARFLGDAETPLPADVERRAREDLLDLVILSADLGVRLAPPETAAAARQEALRRLDEAEALLGPGPALRRAREALAEGPSPEDPTRAASSIAAAEEPRSARAQYELGLELLRRGELEPAAAALERACALRPGEFWPQFHRGLCAARLGRPADAVAAFSVCTALRPEAAPCYAHRARAWEALGRPDRAEADFDRALELDPTLAGAWANRGALKLRVGRPTEAINDFRRALDSGAAPAPVYYNLALAHLALGNRTQALASARSAVRADPAHRSARTLIDELTLPP